jgi:hypothetical protein
MGGTYEPSNVLKCNVAMHAFLHKCLWEEHGRWQDKIAWLTLSGLISQEEARVAACRNISDEARQKLSELMKAKQADPAYRAKRAAARWANPKEHEAHSARMKGKKYALGNRLTDEQRAKISASLKGNQRSLGKGHPQSIETRAKISATKRAQRMEYDGQHS